MDISNSLPSSIDLSFFLKIGEFIPLILGVIFVLILFRIFAFLWISHKNMIHIESLNWIMLEVRIPKDVFKSPLAMEVILMNAFAQGHPDNWYEKSWQGKLGSWFSLEIVSLEGKIHFVIRTEKKYKNLIETQIYSQYPEAEVAEVDDYVDFVPPFVAGNDWSMFGTEFALTKPDPYPIKTYIDYGLNNIPKKDEPDFRVDPMTPLIEYLGSLGKGEQAWVQILVQRPQKRYTKKKDGSLGDWTDQGKDLIKELSDVHKGDKDKPGEPMTKGKMDIINAIERSIGKVGFDCGIRVIYIAKKDAFKAENIAGLSSALKHYSSNDLNGFKPVNTTRVKYPWQDYFGKVVVKKKKKMFEAYKLRSFFYPPYKREPFVLTSEELATIYHLPGKVSAAPTLKRIDSKKSEAPDNLPI